MTLWLKVRLVRAFLKSLASSNDTKTTVLGIVAAALIAAQLNWSQLLEGDADQIGMAAGAVVAALWGYFTNKKDKDAQRTQSNR